MTPKTFDDLISAILAICPQAELDEIDGQIVIWTGLTENQDSTLSEYVFDESEENNEETEESDV